MGVGQSRAPGHPGAWQRGALALVLAGAIPAGASAQQAATAKAAASLVFDGVTVVDVEQGRLVSDRRVVIVGTRIQAMGNVAAVKVPKGAQVVDARGKYLIPGLWDLHIHPQHLAPDVFYPLLLANGVTGIRDPGSGVPLDTLLRWRREIVTGKRVGPPRQILVGQYISEEGRNGVFAPCQRSKHKGIETCVSTTAGDAQHLVDSLKAAGADMIKLYDVSHDLYFRLAAEARRIGVPFGGHLYSWVALADASDSGTSIIDHGWQSDELQSLCLGATASVAQCQPLAERFRRNGTWWVPTFSMKFGDPSTPEVVITSFQQFSREFWKSDTVSHGKWTPGFAPNPVADASGRLLRLAQQVDLPILAGTDASVSRVYITSPGLSLHGELAAYVAEGLTPANALRTATLNPAKLLHGTDSLGTVAPGQLADLVLLDADPLADITNTLTIRAVVANGRYYDRAALDRVLANVKATAKEKQLMP